MIEDVEVRVSRPRLVAQKIKSTILRPVGTVVNLFDVSDAIALTFDDGPDRQVTPAVLDVLRKHGAKATFFVLTDYASAHPDLVQRILEDGHEIGLHFDRHDRITELPAAVVWERMVEARRVLERLAGPISLFRPPYGSQNYLTYFIARLLGLEVVGWSRCANDWLEQTAESAARAAYERMSGGDVVLMHDGMELEPDEPRPTFDKAEMVELFLQAATARGLKSITVSALLARGPARRSHWFR